MTAKNPFAFHLNGRSLFLQQFLKHPLQIGSVIPSSRFLERRIVRSAEVDSAEVVVELGPGTGGTTRALLAALPPHARLLSIEINPRFHAMVSAIPDPRLIVHRGSADTVREALARHALAAPDAIVSGIPFSTMPRDAGVRTMEAIASVLAPGGRFVAYQFSGRVDALGRDVLGPARSSIELLNLPPMRVYRWRKPVDPPAAHGGNMAAGRHALGRPANPR